MYSKYINAFTSLSTNITDGCKSADKAILLVSVIELIESREIQSPKIVLSQRLEEVFHDNCLFYGKMGSSFDILLASLFWHMQNEPFWTITVNRASDFDKYSIGHLRKYAHATIEDKLYEALTNDSVRKELKMVLIEEYLQGRVNHKTEKREKSKEMTQEGEEMDFTEFNEMVAACQNEIDRSVSSIGENMVICKLPEDYVAIIKRYIEDSQKGSDDKARFYIIKLYNACFDEIDERGVPHLNDLPEERLAAWTFYFHDIIKCAAINKKTKLIIYPIALFILGGFALRIYGILEKEMILINSSLEAMSTKMLMGGLTMQDYSKFEAINNKKDEVIIIQKFLQKIRKIAEKKYNMKMIFFKKIEI